MTNFIESDPINSLLLWEGLFYERLDSSLEDNSKNAKIENEIKEKLDKIKNLFDISNTGELINKNKDDSKSDWKAIFSQRDNLFFNLIINVVNYIYSKKEASNDVNWLNIAGFDSLLNAIIHEVHSRPVKSFPKQFKQIFKLFINNSEITNALINRYNKFVI